MGRIRNEHGTIGGKQMNNQCVAVVEPKNKNPEMPLRYHLEMELLGSQNSRLFDQRNKLLDMVEKLQSEKPVEQEPETIQMMQTPVGHVKVGDIISHNRRTKQVRFGKVCGFTEAKQLVIKHGFTVEFGEDNQQIIYQILDITLDPSEVCKIL